MENRLSKKTIRRAASWALLGCVFFGTEKMTADVSQGAHDATVVVVPKRRLTNTGTTELPALPAGTAQITPATLEVVIRRDAKGEATHVMRQTILRTADRVRIASDDGGEWLFERNPIDPRRVSATMVEHAKKTVVLYEETDLRMALGVRGWADVMALGFDSQRLSTYQRTGEARKVGGLEFVRYASHAKSGAVEDVWWSDEQLFPSRFAISDTSGVTRFDVEKITTGVDAELLRPAILRFPRYQAVDLSNWLEKD